MIESKFRKNNWENKILLFPNEICDNPLIVRNPPYFEQTDLFLEPYLRRRCLSRKSQGQGCGKNLNRRIVAIVLWL